MILRLLAVSAVLLLSACGQTGPLYRPGAAPPPPKPLVMDSSSGHTEPAAITVPPPKPALAQPAAEAAPDSVAPVERKEDVNVVPPMESDADSSSNKK